MLIMTETKAIHHGIQSGKEGDKVCITHDQVQSIREPMCLAHFDFLNNPSMPRYLLYGIFVRNGITVSLTNRTSSIE